MRQLLFLFLLPLCHGQHLHDILVTDQTRVQRCIMDGSSSRMIAVGTPARINYSFDAQYCAPRHFWIGGFLNFGGELKGRGGGHCQILGTPQSFGTPETPLRINDPNKLPSEVTFRGYRVDGTSKSPTFLFLVDGVSAEQTVVVESKNIIHLQLDFPNKSNHIKYYHLDPRAHQKIELSKNLTWHSPNIIAIPPEDESATISLHLSPPPKPFVRKVTKLSGAQLYKNYCSSCHSLDGSKLIGPSFAKLHGETRTVIRDGRKETLTVDPAYLKESILAPQAAIVEGYEAVPMASFQGVLQPDQIDRIVTFLKERSQ